MNNPNFRKNKRILTLFLLATTISLFTFSQIIWNSNNFFHGAELDTEFEMLNRLKASDYSSSFDSPGENINITLHQSLLNSTDKEFTNLDIANTFLQACPADDTFNSSYVNITVDDISAPNKSLDVETNINTFQSLFTQYYTSFEVPSDGYLTAVEINVDTNFQGSTTFTYDVYAAKYDTAIRPDTTKDLTGGGTLGTKNNDSDTDVWLRLDSLNQLLDVSNTYNNTFFIQISATQAFSQWNADSTSGNTISYALPTNPELALDFTLKVELSPLNNTPDPEDIGLQMNNINVTNSGTQGKGYWTPQSPLGDNDGDLDFQVTAAWWNVSCNVTNVEINYTKTDLYASSEFNIAGSGQAVKWNVTRNGGLNYFDLRFDNFQINYSIPEAWDNPSIRVFNGEGDERTSSIIKRLLGNDYREVSVPNAGNGTYWFLNATSTNLLDSIDTYLGISPANTFNFTDIARFNATFDKEISDGTINLSVYSPAIINDKLNHSVQTQSFTGSEIFITDWDISNDVTQYGNFRVHVYWNNNTEAGFMEKLITILGETSLTPTLPVSTFDAGDIFDIELYFEDTGLSQGIESATITYKIESGPIRSDNINITGNGYYNITIDCNDADFGAYGPNSIELNASKDFYNNQSDTIEITILGETTLDDTIPKLSFNSTETFDVSLFFNDTVKGIGIDTAIIEVYADITQFYPSITDYSDGNYDITINCSADVFDDQGYGSFNLIIDVEKSYYYNRSVSYTIDITGETSLSTSKFPDPSIGYYNSDETFNITANFVDVGRTEGIIGGQVKVYVKEVSGGSYQEYTTSIFEYGFGYYNITIDCSNALFNPYGKYNIKVNVTKTNYYLAEDILEEIIVGNTTLTILDPTGTLNYDEDEVFNIVIEYKDHTTNEGINQSFISYSLHGAGFRSDNYVDNLDGTYTITIYANDTQFDPNYGDVDVLIWANKTNYINLTKTLTFERRILTNITPSNTPSLMEEIRGNSIFYTFKYSDRLGTPITTYDDFEITTPLQNFGWNLVNDGGGNYTLELNTSQVLVIPTPYTLNFSIYTFGNQEQEISFTILITIIQTSIEIDSWNDYADFARSTNINISIDFYFNDTTNIQAITGLTNGDIFVNNFETSTTWSPGFELFNRAGNGNYTLNISTIGADSDFYTLELNVSKSPNFNWSLAQIQFTLRGNYTEIHLISVSDTGGQLTPIGLYNFTIFEGDDITTEFNVTDLEYGNSLVIGAADTYSIWYENLLTGDNGTLLNNLIYDLNFDIHIGSIFTSNTALTPGNYLINITITKSNYESTYFSFNLTVIAKYQVRLNFTYLKEVDAGDPFTIVVKVEYLSGSIWYPLDLGDVRLTPYFNDDPSTIQILATNSTGEVLFSINVLGNAITMNLTIQLLEDYYHIGDTYLISDIEVNPLPTGLSFEDLIPYLIIIGAAVVLVGGSIGVYRGVIVPKKREKSRILKEVKTIFDDAINLEHILLLYKGTGTCVYFKSFGSEEIDPELISGFISAICSFGKDL
ncbi:MAG: hypothetical protein ACXACX_20660, partial [Candidatus Hodarchaeales archaeon]